MAKNGHITPPIVQALLFPSLKYFTGYQTRVTLVKSSREMTGGLEHSFLEAPSALNVVSYSYARTATAPSRRTKETDMTSCQSPKQGGRIRSLQGTPGSNLCLCVLLGSL